MDMISSSQQFDRPDQAKAYSQFRPEPPKELLDAILSYLGEKASTELLLFTSNMLFDTKTLFEQSKTFHVYMVLLYTATR
ncbi:hypothetical protein TNCT_215851 [Trichonephila clavata]|uniref:Uncharacterized protein n=1 Tax=Trichonephila clavata TaxID=2740835 RepID=A0A8X6GVX5_TRICU|nr:hypothetical protein TNCT_215851 [Trichonephila clavata]